MTYPTYIVIINNINNYHNNLILHLLRKDDPVRSELKTFPVYSSITEYLF
jgi:hypothetical protein